MAIENLPENKTQEAKSFMEWVALAEEKTRFTLMLELLKESNLEYVTEYPNFNYTKAMTKLSTWRESVRDVFNLEEQEADTVVKEMCVQFMRKNVSHKRRRAHELVNALRSEDVGSNVLDHEHKGLRRFLGLR